MLTLLVMIGALFALAVLVLVCEYVLRTGPRTPGHGGLYHDGKSKSRK